MKPGSVSVTRFSSGPYSQLPELICPHMTMTLATARLMRSAVLSVREEMYIEAMRAMGAGAPRIMLRHIVPNCITSVAVHATIQVGWAILLSATLSFVGVGVQAPLPEWGLLTSSGRQYMMIAWWYATLPGLAIVLTVMAFNLVGDGLRDVFDPRMRGR